VECLCFRSAVFVSRSSSPARSANQSRVFRLSPDFPQAGGADGKADGRRHPAGAGATLTYRSPIASPLRSETHPAHSWFDWKSGPAISDANLERTRQLADGLKVDFRLETKLRRRD
jgi:hypothetical protein